MKLTHLINEILIANKHIIVKHVGADENGENTYALVYPHFDIPLLDIYGPLDFSFEYQIDLDTEEILDLDAKDFIEWMDKNNILYSTEEASLGFERVSISKQHVEIQK